MEEQQQQQSTTVPHIRPTKKKAAATPTVVAAAVNETTALRLPAGILKSQPKYSHNNDKEDQQSSSSWTSPSATEKLAAIDRILLSDPADEADTANTTIQANEAPPVKPSVVERRRPVNRRKRQPQPAVDTVIATPLTDTITATADGATTTTTATYTAPTVPSPSMIEGYHVRFQDTTTEVAAAAKDNQHKEEEKEKEDETILPDVVCGSLSDLMALAGTLPENTAASPSKQDIRSAKAIEADVSFTCMAPETYQLEQELLRQEHYKKCLGLNVFDKKKKKKKSNNPALHAEEEEEDSTDTDDDGESAQDENTDCSNEQVDDDDEVDDEDDFFLFAQADNDDDDNDDDDDDEHREEKKEAQQRRTYHDNQNVRWNTAHDPPRAFMIVWNALAQWVTPAAVAFVQHIRENSESDDTNESPLPFTPPHNNPHQQRLDRSDVEASRCAGLMALLQMHTKRCLEQVMFANAAATNAAAGTSTTNTTTFTTATTRPNGGAVTAGITVPVSEDLLRSSATATAGTTTTRTKTAVSNDSARTTTTTSTTFAAETTTAPARTVVPFEDLRRAERRLSDLLMWFDYRRSMPKLDTSMARAVTCVLLDMIWVQQSQEQQQQNSNNNFILPVFCKEVGMKPEEYRYLVRSGITNFGLPHTTTTTTN